MEDLISFVQNEFVEKKEFPEFSAGDTITVYYEIREGEKVRTQFFRGVVIQVRIFPINMPAIQKIEINKRGKVRRSRIYYFRGLTGKKARIKEVRK